MKITDSKNTSKLESENTTKVDMRNTETQVQNIIRYYLGKHFLEVIPVKGDKQRTKFEVTLYKNKNITDEVHTIFTLFLNNDYIVELKYTFAKDLSIYTMISVAKELESILGENLLLKSIISFC